MRHPNTDRNLLFGILALQMEFISRDGLIEAMNAWVLDKSKPLGDILVAREALAQQDRDLLEPMVDRHVEIHGGDPEKSLASISPSGSVHEDLVRIADPDIQASLPRLSAKGEPRVDTGASSRNPGRTTNGSNSNWLAI